MLLRLATALCLCATALSQTNTFEIRANGEKVGVATYTLAKTKSGYKLSVRSDARLGSTPSEVTEDFTYDENYAYQDGAIANRDIHLYDSYVPNKTRTEMLAARSRGGRQDSSTLAIKPAVAVLPGLDPGSAQVMLLLALTHPTATNTYSILVPGGGEGGGGGEEGGKRGGRGGGKGAAPNPAVPVVVEEQGPKPGGDAADATWKKGQDMNGMLDGKPVPIHVYQLASGSFRWIFFADSDNKLMQVSLPALHASYVRQNFKLDLPPAAPLAPRKP